MKSFLQSLQLLLMFLLKISIQLLLWVQKTHISDYYLEMQRVEKLPVELLVITQLRLSKQAVRGEGRR